MGKLVTFVVAVAFQSVIPWIVALVKKKPMTKKGFRILSVIFGLLPVGSTHEALIEANISNSLATIVAFFLRRMRICCVLLCRHLYSPPEKSSC